MLLIRNIKGLAGAEDTPRRLVCGQEMRELTVVPDSWLLTDGDVVRDFGKMPCPEPVEKSVQGGLTSGSRILDASGRFVLPSFCDSHTHLVYAGSREMEYVDKIRGLSYEEIARRGGGILNSAKRLQEASEEELVEQALPRLEEIMMLGTGAVEIKSGYGLTVENEMKMLRVIRRLKELTPLKIVATFLGAHAVPFDYRGRQGAFVDLVIREMIPLVAGENLADFIDVFCDRGFFSVEETDRMLEAGAKYGLRPKIHANELDFSGGVQVGVKHGALSVDHLEYVDTAEIEALQGSGTMPTILPGAAFFLNLIHSPARRMIDEGLPVAFASDFNPGSSPSGNMQLVLSMACINYRLLPEEAVNATTLNTAYAMGISDRYGSIARGKVANLFITKPIPTVEFIPYAYGSNKVETVILNGKVIK